MVVLNKKAIQDESKAKELLLKEVKASKKSFIDYDDIKWDCEA